ncbi:MAG: aminotransferase class I/II-fold pyridoxal phosphate-dependent enzyme [Erysipelotrichaceae bacterium]|nr:aminotransferase class I/II-fold pyridoxal phosphate-dependent enzyme [Erysipelotrichaceae bacterium]
MNNQEFTEKYYIRREKGNSVKWQRGRKEKCLPMWIADMDFKDDERVIFALKDFIEEGDYGYANLPQDYYKVFIDWHKRRNDIEYRQEWIRFTRGAVDAMYQIIYSLTDSSDGILICTPLYPPFKATIKESGRKVYESKMINNDGFFTFDYKDIEKKFRSKKIRMMMLCSPHNPVGRVFKKGELEELFDLCHQYHVLIVSDEVHSDIIMPDQEFIPSLAFRKYRNEIISIVAASKSFSLAVFSHCHVIIPNAKLRKKFIEYQRHNHLGSVNAFNALPTYYNYLYGEKWLDSLNNVVFENYEYFRKQLGNELEISTLEGSYLIFVNIGEYSTESSAAKCLQKDCGLLVNAGETFGKGYDGWVRINLATSMDNVKKAVRNIKKLIRNKAAD